VLKDQVEDKVPQVLKDHKVLKDLKEDKVPKEPQELRQ
jgi:hypothetical protein